MIHEVHFPILKQLGLNESEALIYELLLEFGRLPAQDLLAPSGLGRGNVYNILTSLKKKGLVTEIKGKKTVFEAAPPSKLATLIDRERSKIDQLSASFSGILPFLSSEYHLSTGKPIIQVFEGLDGAERAILDSVDSKTEILTYYDFAVMKDRMVEIDERYYKAYVAKGVQKRILVSDTPEARAYFVTPLKNTRVGFVPSFPSSFNSGVQIYDGKVSFISLKNERLVSIIMADQTLYDLMRQIFEFSWAQANGVVGPLVLPLPVASLPPAEASAK